MRMEGVEEEEEDCYKYTLAEFQSEEVKKSVRYLEKPV